ncbi:hypothetical protein [Hymenobacter terrenus]|uniref:hypothetical protein n=1 Tax=Hymenobacter terrenus TaxID=1629124 RepID=UPI000696ED3A|nr:hypothetical protein [Hymenobacter terrenus]
MKNLLRLFVAPLLALPVAAAAQTTTTTNPASKSTTTTPAPASTSPAGMQPQTEVTEDLDPATGKVIRRTTRTIYVPMGTPAPSTASKTTAPTTSSDVATSTATDAQVSTFLRKKTAIATLTAPALLAAYQQFIERVRTDRHSWKASDWTAAAAILSSLNGRYDQLRSSLSLDDKLTIRSQQAEFQTLRTARQLSDQVSDKL